MTSPFQCWACEAARRRFSPSWPPLSVQQRRSAICDRPRRGLDRPDRLRQHQGRAGRRGTVRLSGSCRRWGPPTGEPLSNSVLVCAGRPPSLQPASRDDELPGDPLYPNRRRRLYRDRAHGDRLSKGGGRLMGAFETFGWEWGSALLRWLHVTAAIAWIGGSFFFMHLDASPAQEGGRRSGARGNLLAGARRRLLSDEQIPARAGRAARGSHLAQVAVLLDLDERLCAALLGLLRPVAALSHRSRGHGARALAGGADRDRRRSRSAGSSTISSAARRSPPTSRCSRSSASAMSWRRAGSSPWSFPAAARSSIPAR